LSAKVSPFNTEVPPDISKVPTLISKHYLS
jgi:hypothetical protein